MLDFFLILSVIAAISLAIWLMLSKGSKKDNSTAIGMGSSISFLNVSIAVLIASVTLNAVIGGLFSLKSYVDFEELEGLAAKTQTESSAAIERVETLQKKNENLNFSLESNLVAVADMNRSIEDFDARLTKLRVFADEYQPFLVELRSGAATTQIEKLFDEIEKLRTDINAQKINSDKLASSSTSVEPDIHEPDLNNIKYRDTNKRGYIFYGNRKINTKSFSYIEYFIEREADNRSGNYGIYPHEGDILRPNQDYERALRTEDNENGTIIKSLNTNDVLRVLGSKKSRSDTREYIWVEAVLLEKE